MVAAGSILLVLNSCSEKEAEPPQPSTVPVKKPFPDLSLAIQKRVEKKTGRSDRLTQRVQPRTFQTPRKF